ncbi:MAG TPA: CoA pyrophosphatase [Candidatus Sulfopaludibacter sp.]|jgi:8-oxo-dGTP pyrophosphatase MutT (NUDIX family)|nr:CoA pyrophosphatase [Candidatus Sulfopaludibacter sp.]
MSQPDAAVAIVHTRSQPESVLLMRRSERPDDSWSGHWSLPGGRWDPADRDAVHTALRELEEECGLRLTPADLEGELPHAIARRKTPPYLLVAPFVFRVDRELPTTLDAREAVESLWIPVETLADTSRHVLQPVPSRPPEMLFPTIELRGTPLWGFTYRLLIEWLKAAAEPGMAIAESILAFLVERGLPIVRPWHLHDGVQLASVGGPIPVEAVRTHFTGTGPHVSSISMLEIQHGLIRLIGAAFDEYVISSGNF